MLGDDIYALYGLGCGQRGVVMEGAEVEDEEDEAVFASIVGQ